MYKSVTSSEFKISLNRYTHSVQCIYTHTVNLAVVLLLWLLSVMQLISVIKESLGDSSMLAVCQLLAILQVRDSLSIDNLILSLSL